MRRRKIDRLERDRLSHFGGNPAQREPLVAPQAGECAQQAANHARRGAGALARLIVIEPDLARASGGDVALEFGIDLEHRVELAGLDLRLEIRWRQVDADTLAFQECDQRRRIRGADDGQPDRFGTVDFARDQLEEQQQDQRPGDYRSEERENQRAPVADSIDHFLRIDDPRRARKAELTRFTGSAGSAASAGSVGTVLGDRLHAASPSAEPRSDTNASSSVDLPLAASNSSAVPAATTRP